MKILMIVLLLLFGCNNHIAKANSGNVIPSFQISRNPISITFGSSITEMGHDYVMMQ